MTAPVRFVVVEMSEAEWVSERGGGFAKRIWYIEAPSAAYLAGKPRDPTNEDLWLHPQRFVTTPPAGYSTSLTSRGGLSPDSDSAPAGYAWRREFTVTVPVGTRLRRCVSHPDRERAAADETLRRMPRRLEYAYFTVDERGELISDQVIAARAPARPTSEAPLAREGTLAHIGNVLDALENIK